MEGKPYVGKSNYSSRELLSDVFGAVDHHPPLPDLRLRPGKEDEVEILVVRASCNPAFADVLPHHLKRAHLQCSVIAALILIYRPDKFEHELLKRKDLTECLLPVQHLLLLLVLIRRGVERHDMPWNPTLGHLRLNGVEKPLYRLGLGIPDIRIDPPVVPPPYSRAVRHRYGIPIRVFDHIMTAFSAVEFREVLHLASAVRKEDQIIYHLCHSPAAFTRTVIVVGAVEKAEAADAHLQSLENSLR